MSKKRYIFIFLLVISCITIFIFVNSYYNYTKLHNNLINYFKTNNIMVKDNYRYSVIIENHQHYEIKLKEEIIVDIFISSTPIPYSLIANFIKWEGCVPETNELSIQMGDESCGRIEKNRIYIYIRKKGTMVKIVILNRDDNEAKKNFINKKVQELLKHIDKSI